MKACIHRGSVQIGGSCIELTSGESSILLDLGLPLDAKDNEANQLPETLHLNDLQIKAVIISHPHLDHYGLLMHLDPNIPVIMGKAALQIISAAAPFIPNSTKFINIQANLSDRQPLKIGPFTITPYLVDHSAFDSYALLVEADGKRLFYSGDLRMHGRKSPLTEHLMSHPPKDIDVLLLEGSSLGRLQNNGQFETETDIEHKLIHLFKNAQGLTLIQASAQNIDRMVTIYRACKQSGKIMVIDLYTAVILSATGRTNIPQSDWQSVKLFIPQRQREYIKKEKLFDLLHLHDKNRIYLQNLTNIKERCVLLVRPIHLYDLQQNQLLDNATHIYSQWSGYWESENNRSVRNTLAKIAIQAHFIHTSGHASPIDLQRFALALKPKVITPIHTFEPAQFEKLLPNTQLKKDGELWQI